MEFQIFLNKTPLDFALTRGNIEITKHLLHFKSNHPSKASNSNEIDLCKLPSISLKTKSKKDDKDSSLSNSIGNKKIEYHSHLANATQVNSLKGVKQNEEKKQSIIHALDNTNKEEEQNKPVKKLPRNRTRRRRKLHEEDDEIPFNYQPQPIAQGQFYYPAPSAYPSQLGYQPQMAPQFPIYYPQSSIQNQLNYQQQQMYQLMQINKSLQAQVNMQMMQQNEMQDDLISKNRRRKNHK